MFKTAIVFAFSTLTFITCSKINVENSKINNDVSMNESHQNKQALDFEILTFKENGSENIKGNSVIKNQDEFRLVWKQIHSKFTPTPTTPSVDFSSNQVLFIDFGQRNYGGQVYEIENINVEKDTAIVTFKKQNVDPSEMMATMAITKPFMFIKINQKNINHIQVK